MSVWTYELGPTPDARHDDAARRHRVDLPNTGDTLHHVGGGGELLQKPPPPKGCSSPPLLSQYQGRAGWFACSFDNPVLNTGSKFFVNTLTSPLP